MRNHTRDWPTPPTMSGIERMGPRHTVADYDSPLPRAEEKKRNLLVDHPWLGEVHERLADRPVAYAPAMFSNPALVPRPSSGIAQPSQKTPLPVAPDAFRGIELALTARLPPSDGTDMTRSIRCAHGYKLYPAVMTQPGGAKAIVYWRAVNTETKRADFAVGPAMLDTFLAHAKDYADVATRAFANGEPDAVVVESMKVVDAAMKDGPRAAAKQLAVAWKTALSDPEWVVRTTTEIATAAATAPRAASRSTSTKEASAATRARYYEPTEVGTSSLAPGQGETDMYGNVKYSTKGTASDVALARAHESVHSFLSPKALNGLRELRAQVGMLAYQNSAVCRYLEEALAETYAQVEVNGLRALPDGLTFPIRNGYVTIRSVVTEAAVGTIAYGGVLYGVTVAVERP